MLMSALRVSPVYSSAHAWCVGEFPMLFPFTVCLSRSRRRCSTIAASHPCWIELGSYLVTYLTCTNTSFTTLHLWSWTGRVRDHYMFLHAYGELHAPSPRFAGLIRSWLHVTKIWKLPYLSQQTSWCLFFSCQLSRGHDIHWRGHP